MKILVPLLLLTSAASAQGFLQNPQFGIRGVTRRTPMVIPQIEANQIFAAGGVNGVTPGNAVGAGLGGYQNSTPPINATGPLADAGDPPARPATIAPTPTITYRAPAIPKPRATTGNSTNLVAAIKPKYDPATSGAVIRSHWAGDEPAAVTTATVASVERK